MPLTALLNGSIVIAGESTKGNNYKCKFCDSEMILKAGKIKIHHFAHIVINDCKTKPETIEHLKMKLLVAKLTGGELEVKIGNTIYDVKSGQRVFECQCSPIPIEEMEQRQDNAHRFGLDLTWIFGSEKYYKIDKYRSYLIRLTAAELEAKDWQEKLFYYFCTPLKEEIICILPTKQKWSTGYNGKEFPCKTIWFYKHLFGESIE